MHICKLNSDNSKTLFDKNNWVNDIKQKNRNEEKP